MRVLVVGSGGREHALVWKLAQSPELTKLYVAPGNPGMEGLAQRVPIKVTELDRLADFAAQERVDLTVVGPEAPLVAGLADVFASRGLRVFGPSRDAATIEGSKAFAKQVMQRAGVPTADGQAFDDPDRALRYAEGQSLPVVIKADGLAAGKGVIVARTRLQVREAIDRLMRRRAFGAAGERVVVEEFLEGEECSVMALVDGERILPLAPSQDHKRLLDGDEGPNTGGMGAYSPVPFCTAASLAAVAERILAPTVRALAEAGRPYRGLLYAGLMFTADGPRVLEFNARFGDPETQAVLPRLPADLLPLLDAAARGALPDRSLAWDNRAACTVVAASQGYPGEYQAGQPISGLAEAAALSPQALIFHAGTECRDGRWLTAGGRVLAVTGLGEDLFVARDLAYDVLERVSFPGMYYRRDIALRHAAG